MRAGTLGQHQQQWVKAAQTLFSPLHVPHIAPPLRVPTYKSVLKPLCRAWAQPPRTSSAWQGRRRPGNRAGPAAPPPPRTWGDEGRSWEGPSRGNAPAAAGFYLPRFVTGRETFVPDRSAARRGPALLVLCAVDFPPALAVVHKPQLK